MCPREAPPDRTRGQHACSSTVAARVAAPSRRSLETGVSCLAHERNGTQEKHAMPSASSFISYRARVRRLAQARQGDPVYNDTLDHAAVIMQNMFSYAGESVRILTGSLNPDVYGRAEIVEEARHFLRKSNDREIYILFEDKEATEDRWRKQHSFLSGLMDYSRQIHLRFVPDEWQETYDFHFVVMDDDSYRFEPDKTMFRAVAAFGDRPGGSNLRGLFDRLWSNGIMGAV